MRFDGTSQKPKIDWERSEQIKTNVLAKAIWRGLKFTVSQIEKAMRGEKV